MERQKETSNDLIVLISMSALAPLVSHLLTLVYGSNSLWSTERLLVLYFTVLTGEIITSRMFYDLEKSRFFNRLFQRDDFDAPKVWLQLILVSMVAIAYDYTVCVIVLILLMLVAITILWRDSSKVKFNRKTYLICLISMGIMVVFLQNVALEYTPITWMKFLLAVAGVSLPIAIIHVCIKKCIRKIAKR